MGNDKNESLLDKSIISFLNKETKAFFYCNLTLFVFFIVTISFSPFQNSKYRLVLDAFSSLDKVLECDKFFNKKTNEKDTNYWLKYSDFDYFDFLYNAFGSLAVTKIGEYTPKDIIKLATILQLNKIEKSDDFYKKMYDDLIYDFASRYYSYNKIKNYNEINIIKPLEEVFFKEIDSRKILNPKLVQAFEKIEIIFFKQYLMEIDFYLSLIKNYGNISELDSFYETPIEKGYLIYLRAIFNQIQEDEKNVLFWMLPESIRQVYNNGKQPLFSRNLIEVLLGFISAMMILIMFSLKRNNFSKNTMISFALKVSIVCIIGMYILHFNYIFLNNLTDRWAEIKCFLISPFLFWIIGFSMLSVRWFLKTTATE